MGSTQVNGATSDGHLLKHGQIGPRAQFPSCQMLWLSCHHMGDETRYVKSFTPFLARTDENIRQNANLTTHYTSASSLLCCLLTDINSNMTTLFIPAFNMNPNSPISNCLSNPLITKELSYDRSSSWNVNLAFPLQSLAQPDEYFYHLLVGIKLWGLRVLSLGLKVCIEVVNIWSHSSRTSRSKNIIYKA